MRARLHLLQLIIGEMVAPLVAVTGELDAVEKHLRGYSAGLLKASGLEPRAAGAQLGRGERTIYRYHEGYAPPSAAPLLSAVLSYLARKPGVQAVALKTWLRRAAPRLDADTADRLLAWWYQIGAIGKTMEEVDGQHIDLAYHAPKQISEAEVKARGEHIADRLSQIRMILEHFLSGVDAAVISHQDGRVTPAELRDFHRDLYRFSLHRWDEALERSKGSPEARLAACVFLSGPLGRVV